ncbi:hypothetical protein LJC63_12985 [Ruminococcaceae bacterium OttesenSCG-928-L11]|nr:hypothetical protein [Ruminococcaceae bacterium OttesenSCG-928-L11]
MLDKGMEGLSFQEVNREIIQGGKFVVYQYCISIVFMTFRRSSGVVFVKAGANAALTGLPYTLLSLLLGWWGFPWGPIYTVQSLVTNFGGGRDVTNEVRSSLYRAENNLDNY